MGSHPVGPWWVDALGFVLLSLCIAFWGFLLRVGWEAGDKLVDRL